MADRTFGTVQVVVGNQNGKYPYGNSVLVRGRDTSCLIDPSLSIVARADEFRGTVDRVLLSHAHEDHMPGVSLFPSAAVSAHTEDVLGIQSLDGLMTMYGYAGAAAEATREFVLNQFHYQARSDAEGFADGAVFDLGGTTVRAIHTPGHTRGHCVFLIEPEGVLFLGDIELSSFGPYYGDAWSDLDAFERSLDIVAAIEARVWVSFHHVGVIEDRAAFDERFAKFRNRIAERETALLDFLREPRTIAEMVERRFLYPPHAVLPFIDAVEQRTIEQHLARLAARGAVQRDDDRWTAR